MSIGLLLLNGLKAVDFGFFIGCAVVIGLIVLVYYLIPVFNKKQYEEQRENLRKREAAFNANRRTADEEVNLDSSEGEAVVEGSSEDIGISAQLDNLSDDTQIECVEAIEELQSNDAQSTEEGGNDI